MKFYFLVFCCLISFYVKSQGIYAPPAGQLGSTAIHKDSSDFIEWASSATIQRGYQQITNKGLGLATVGSISNVYGKANGQVISLGDSGVVILSLSSSIYNGAGPDFAVFENSFSETFLELAVIEVSSDGINYVRFPNYYTAQGSTQVGTFGSVDATHLYNLAGKYKANFGTPFDLDDISDTNVLDKSAVTHIKILDAIGSITNPTLDSDGNKINDPFPTPFASGGFDLDAVGFIHVNTVGMEELRSDIVIYPNPVMSMLTVKAENIQSIRLVNISGQIIKETLSSTINMEAYPSGVYFLTLVFNNKIVTKQIFKQ